MKRLHFLGQLLRSDTGHAYHGRALDEQPTTDELEAITRRQTIHVLQRCADGAPLPLDETLKPVRDVRLVVAVVCLAVVGVGALVGLILEVCR